MDLFSTQFASALAAIIIIDLVLAGDNAIVIALAARTLPKQMQRPAILWGTLGAILVRVLMTLVVVWLLTLPGLRLVGGLMLVWIAWTLLAADNQHDDASVASIAAAAAVTFASAIRTIVVADAVMGLDNVLGVAGAAKGSFVLVVLGLAISIPIMIWGSTLILKLVDRHPVIVYLGAGVLAWTAAVMIVHEPRLELWIAPQPWLRILVYVVVIGGVLGAGYLTKRRRARPPT